MASLAEFLQAQQQFQNQPNALDYYKNISQAQMMPMEMDLKRLEARKTFEDYENTQRLRELFAQSQGMPDIASVGQYSPDMAIKLQQAQLENMAKQAQIRESGMRTGKIGQEMQMEKGKAFANAIGPYGDQYYMDIQSNMPEGQALNKFRRSVGQALQQLEQQGLTPDAQINMNALTPDAALRAASGHGYRSQHLESQQKMGEMGYGSQLELGREQYKRQLPPAPSAEQYYGGVQMTPQGPMRQPPIMGPQAAPFEVVGPDAMQGMQQAPMGAADIDNLRTMYQQAQGPEKERLGAMLADAIKQSMPRRGGFVTPEQRQQMVVEEKAAETKAQEEAKAQVAQSEARKQKAEVLSSLPTVPELNKLIDQSMSGQIEAIGKGKLLGEIAGVPTEALGASKQLEIVAAQMKQITKSLVGAGAVSDFEQRQMSEAAGNIAEASTPAKTRKQQLEMFNRILRKSLMKSPELAKGLNAAEDDATEEEAPEAPSVKRGSKPKIGQVESGYMFKGGNPADPNNWEKQ
jgi:hypothetical protein